MERKRNILLTPGPATTTDTVKMTQVISDICPREKEFKEVLLQIKKDLVKIVAGNENDYACVLFAGSGTCVMDATINSVISPGKKILIVSNGAYGKRLVKIAEAYNIDCVELGFEWGVMPDLTKIEEALQRDEKISYIAMIHHETTTGILNSVKEVGIIAKKFNCVFIVDTISSFAGIPINIKEYNIDFMMSTSNKCIQGMPGVSFVICKRQEIEKTRDYPKRSFYLNLYCQYEYLEKNGEMQFTAPVQTIYALRQAIKEYFEEGGENRYNRYTKNWKVLRQGLLDMGLKLFLKEEVESHLLTTILYPDNPNFDFEILHDQLYKKGFTIYPGKIGYKNTFRIANIGAIDYRDIENFLQNLREVLTQMNTIKGE